MPFGRVLINAIEMKRSTYNMQSQSHIHHKITITHNNNNNHTCTSMIGGVCIYCNLQTIIIINTCYVHCPVYSVYFRSMVGKDQNSRIGSFGSPTLCDECTCFMLYTIIRILPVDVRTHNKIFIQRQTAIR